MPPLSRYMEVSLNYCSQNGGNLYRAPYYNRNLNIGPRIDSNLGQSPHIGVKLGQWKKQQKLLFGFFVYNPSDFLRPPGVSNEETDAEWFN